MPKFCVCGHKLNTYDACNHYFNCPQVKGRLSTMAHDLLVNCLARAARGAGCAVIVEPPVENNAKTDIVISGPAHTVETDVNISDAMAPAYLTAGSFKTQLKAATISTGVKNRKHKANVIGRGHDWLPACFERQGGFSEDAFALCAQISEAAVNNAGFITQAGPFYVSTVQQCAVAIARGNALIQTIGMRDCHHHAAILNASPDAESSGALLIPARKWRIRATRFRGFSHFRY
jgi:hypothetical protein